MKWHQRMSMCTASGMMDDGTYGYSTAQYQMLGQPGFDRQTQ
ncbi:MAG: hypothetical protein EZS28_046158, partial [Streblomastix strix]